MREEHVILVDEEDRELGTEEKLRAHQLGLLHRAFSVFIFRQGQGEREVLLQQRHPRKYHCGGLWTNTCCSHPRPGETVIAAGERRLQEEMGLALPLTLAGRFLYRAELDQGLIEHELDYVLVGYTDAARIEVNPDEVIDYRWVTLRSLSEDWVERHAEFTPWFEEGYKIATNAYEM